MYPEHSFVTVEAEDVEDMKAKLKLIDFTAYKIELLINGE